MPKKRAKSRSSGLTKGSSQGVRILKVRLSARELRRIRFAAVLLDQPQGQFLRLAVLEKADALVRDPELIKRFRDDCSANSGTE